MYTQKNIGCLIVVGALVGGCAEAPQDLSSEIDNTLKWSGLNNLPPSAIDADPLKRANTNAFGVTTANNPDPVRLCQAGTDTGTACTLKSEWNNWRLADATNRDHIVKGLAKCAVGSNYTISAPNGGPSWPGQWEAFPEWKNASLLGQAKRERVSACLLTLLNGNNLELQLCIIGPGTGYNAACDSASMTVREGGFFGDLFAATPTAYVAGPDTSEPTTNGRACSGSMGTYCCAEADAACAHRIVLAGSIEGSPDQSFANKRCNQPLLQATAPGQADRFYCPSFFSTREPGRSYTNVFTTFIPPAE